MEGNYKQIIDLIHLNSFFKIRHTGLNVDAVAVYIALLLDIVSTARDTKVRCYVERVSIISTKTEPYFNSLLGWYQENVFIIFLHVVPELF